MLVLHSNTFVRFPNWIVVCLGISVAAAFCYFFVDAKADLLLFASWMPGDLKAAIEYISAFGHAMGVIICLLLIFTFDSKFKQRIKTVLVASVCSGLIVFLIKMLVHRHRPYLHGTTAMSSHLSNLNLLDSSMQSFPSGHTATALSLAVTMTFFYPQGRNMFFMFAVVTAIQRIATSHHYPSDVLVGAVIGIVTSNVVLIAMKKYQEVFENQVPCG